jgi:hypothetical protein
MWLLATGPEFAERAQASVEGMLEAQEDSQAPSSACVETWLRVIKTDVTGSL